MNFVSDTLPEIRAHLSILAHLRALENATIYAVQKALSKKQTASRALLSVFEPRHYIWETLVAMRACLEDICCPSGQLRLALFVPDVHSNTLKLGASVANKKHTGRSIGFDSEYIAANVFKSGQPQVFADTSKGGFPFIRPTQRRLIRSHICIPILQRRLVLPPKEHLPAPAGNFWGEIMGVLCIDSSKRGAFSGFAGDSGETFERLFDPLVADLYIGLLLSYLKGWKRDE